MNNKLINRFICTTLVSGVSLTMFPKVGTSSTNPEPNGNFGMELHYFESAYECGYGEVDIDVKVYKNAQLVQTMSQGDRLLLTDVDSLSDLSFEYNSLDCPIDANINQILGSQDPIPNLPGAYSQTAIQDMVNNLNSYEELYLAELGTTDTTNGGYDLQDVVLVVNHNPNASPIATDDTAITSIFSSVTIDVLANDTDPDGDDKSITSIDSILGGSAVIEDNKIVYTAGSLPGEFSLTYTVEDEHGNSDIGTVIITIFAFND